MEAWLADNNLYLEASLRWLRLRLQKLVPQDRPAQYSAPAAPIPADRMASTARSVVSRWMNAGAAVERVAGKSVPLLPEGTSSSLDERIAEAASMRQEAAAKMDQPPALLLLAQRFGLSAFEVDTLLLCAASEFDPSIASLFGLAQGGQSRSYPTFSLALSVFDEPRWDVMSSRRPLRY